eukprot:GEMP01074714.1.p1 GENE.GEMP01074714.1~~GEMP01074714.1.p1  ORF type:complete len:176 (+),score=37.25 GEMP01074714.1:57-584(+)
MGNCSQHSKDCPEAACEAISRNCKVLCDQIADGEEIHDDDILLPGMFLPIIADKIRFYVEMDAETVVSMDIILTNQSDQICGQLSKGDVPTFARSHVSCFEKGFRHVLQLDLGKVHDELKQFEVLLDFQESDVKVLSADAWLEENINHETICKLAMWKLVRTPHDTLAPASEIKP